MKYMPGWGTTYGVRNEQHFKDAVAAVNTATAKEGVECTRSPRPVGVQLNPVGGPRVDEKPANGPGTGGFSSLHNWWC